jgi:hypothetical protein
MDVHREGQSVAASPEGEQKEVRRRRVIVAMTTPAPAARQARASHRDGPSPAPHGAASEPAAAKPAAEAPPAPPSSAGGAPQQVLVRWRRPEAKKPEASAAPAPAATPATAAAPSGGARRTDAEFRKLGVPEETVAYWVRAGALAPAGEPGVYVETELAKARLGRYLAKR